LAEIRVGLRSLVISLRDARIEGSEAGIQIEEARDFLEDSLWIPALRFERKIKFTVMNRMMVNWQMI